VSPVKYELEFYIPEDDILHRRRSENFKSYTSVGVLIWDVISDERTSL
jgi:hypothetical protein